MSVIATAIRHLIDAGVSGDALYRAVAELEAATDTRSPGARRMARYRERQGRKEQAASPAVTSVTSVTCDDDDGRADLPPNDINSNPPSPSSADADAIPLLEVIPKAEPLADRVTAAWNRMAAANGLAEARGLSAERRTHLAARVREHGEAAIFEAIERLGASDWHCGRGERGGRGGRGTWKADLGWLLKSGDAFLRILERPHETRRVPVMSEAARAAYLRGLEDKPWANAPIRAASGMETA